MFPLGRSSRATMRLATGSATVAKTIGIVRVSRWSATVTAVESAMMMSGCRLISFVSFDHLIGAQQNRLGHGKAKRLRSLEVHDHLKFGRELDGKLARWG